MIQGIPFGLFYIGGAIVLVVSFVGLVALEPRLAASSGRYWTFDLLSVPLFARMARSRILRFAFQATFAALFIFVIIAGLFGKQQGGANIASILTWTYWWILLVLVIMLFGKAWCWVCPWDAISGWLERLTFWRVNPNGISARLKWPRSMKNLYPATALFLGLTWLELGYGVTTKPEMTAMLGLLMFFLTFIPVLMFERGSFCRYGCLVGRISGLYSLFSSVELRARDQHTCATQCKTHDCYHGNEKGYPCPTFQFLGGMNKNTYCILCGECVQTCPHDNVALNVRPFGSDLMKLSPVRFDEAAMVIVMLAMSTFHGLTMTPIWQDIVRWIEQTFGVSFLIAFTTGMFFFLGALVLLYVIFVRISHLVAKAPEVTNRELAIRYAYAFLPIALFYHFAHNSMHFFVEGGNIVPLLSDPFGWGWNLFGTAGWQMGAMLPFPVIWFMMVAFILIGHVWSLVVGHKIALGIFGQGRSATISQLPMLAAMVAYSVMSLWIIAQPMEMRTAM
jgi:ferredoxin